MRPERADDHSPPSSAAVLEKKNYTSNHPLGHTGTVTGLLYLYHTLTFRRLMYNKVVILHG